MTDYRLELCLMYAPLLDTEQMISLSAGLDRVSDADAERMYSDVREAFLALPEAVAELNAALDAEESNV